MERDDLAPPNRQSLSDDELEVLIQQAHSDTSGTLQAMEVLAQQAQLRQQDDLAFAQWVAKLESIGSPEALAAIAAAKTELGIAPPAPPAANPSGKPTDGVIEPSEPIEEELEYRPVSTLGVAKVEIPDAGIVEPEPLDHDLSPVANVPEVGEIVDVQLDLHTGVAVTDFDVLLHSHVENEDVDFEPEEIDTAAVTTVQKVRSQGAHPSSQLWTWLALGSGLLPIYLGLSLKNLGLSGFQAFLALFIGVVASAVVIGVGAVAGKRSGMPTIFLARSTFGVFGNALTATVLLLARLAFTALIALATLQLLGNNALGFNFDQPLGTGLSAQWFSVGNLILVLVVIASIVLAMLASKTLVWVQLAIGVLGLLALAAAFTQTKPGVEALFVNTNGSWWVTLGAALLIFAGYGGFWAHSSADFTRTLATSANGFKVFGFAVLGAVFPLISGSIGILWAQTEFAVNSESWFAWVMTASLVLSLLAWLMMSLSSSGYALQALGVRISFGWLLPLVGVLAIAAALWAQNSALKVEQLVLGYLPLVGVPLLAWTGLFVSEVLIRRIAYHEVSLQRAYGIYRGINWVTVVGFLAATALGWGYVTSSATGATWLGFLIQISGSSSFWIEAQIGLGMAFLLGALVPVVFGISRIKRQEAEVLAIENRRFELDDVAIDS